MAVGQRALRSAPSSTRGKYPNHFAEQKLNGNSLYLYACSNFGILQRGLARRAKEDDKLPPSKWGKDRTVSDTEDTDPEDQVLDPRVVSNRGKTPVRPSIRNWKDNDDSDDDDCQILEVHDARPIRFSFPVSTTPADSDDQVVVAEPISVGGLHPTGPVRTKRGAGRTRGQPPAKRRKVTTTRPPRKSRPSFKG